MRLGIFAKTFAGENPRDVLAAAAGAGYEVVQYNMACSGLGALPREVPERAAVAVRQASEATGVGLAAVSATYNMIHPDPAMREAGRAAFAAVAGAARLMGTSLVTVCTGSRDIQDQWRRHPDNDRPEAWDDLLAEMRLLLPIAERHDVTIGVEPEAANVVSSARRARDLLAALGHDRLGIVLDPANLFETAAQFRGGAVLDEAVDLLSDRIVMVHAKDRDARGLVVPAGMGVVNLPRVLGSLRRAGFDGPVVTHGLTAAEAPGVARALRGVLDRAG
jgi:sugar phosphate isomerase/epimerase